MHDGKNRTDEPKSPSKRKKLLLPAILAVSLLGGSAGLMTACGDDDVKPDTIVQHDSSTDGTPVDGGIDAPDLLV